MPGVLQKTGREHGFTYCPVPLSIVHTHTHANGAHNHINTRHTHTDNINISTHTAHSVHVKAYIHTTLADHYTITTRI